MVTPAHCRKRLGTLILTVSIFQPSYLSTQDLSSYLSHLSSLKKPLTFWGGEFEVLLEIHVG